MLAYFILFFLRQSLCMQPWLSGTCHVEKAILKRRDLLASTSRTLGLKVNTTTSGKTNFLQFLFPCVWMSQVSQYSTCEQEPMAARRRHWNWNYT